MEPEEHPASSLRDAKINEIIASYLDAFQEGNPTAKTEWFKKYPQYASELSSFFADLGAAKAVIRPTESADIVPLGQVVTQLGNYELLERIGQGGMGAVFKARQVNLNRLVALKLVLAGELASPAHVERFRREAESAARLQHSGIVRIHEVGEQDGQHFFSMDLVSGYDLAAIIQDRSLSPEEAVRYLLRITEAVQYAHEQGVIHRDLKPSNILIDESNEPRITDFGLARRIEEDSDLTESGAVLGTPSYMSPEQAHGKRAEKASDIYALGAILYEMLTARPPFKADSPVETILQVREDEPAPPRQLNAKLPVDLETICLKCLEKDPRKRYASARSLHDDLLRYLRKEPILAMPISQVGRFTRWCRRKPAIAALVAILACLAIISPPVAFYQASLRHLAEQREDEANEAVTRADEARERAEAATERERAAKDELRRLLLAANLNEVARIIVSDYRTNKKRVLELLNRHKPAEDQADFRSFAWHFLWHQCHPQDLTLCGHQDEVFCLAPSSDGKQLASGGRNGELFIWNPISGECVDDLTALGHSQADTSWICCVTYSPDDRVLAYAASDRSVVLYDVAERRKQKSLEGHRGKIFKLAFSPDGRRLIGIGGQSARVGQSERDDSRFGELLVWDVKTGAVVNAISDLPNPLSDVSCSPCGKTIACISNGPWREQEASISTWNTDLFQQQDMLGPSEASNLQALAYSPSGRRLVGVGQQREDLHARLFFYDMKPNSKEPATANWLTFRSFVQAFDFMEDDSTVAVVDNNGIVTVIDLDSRKAKRMVTDSGPSMCISLKYCPKQERIAASGLGGEEICIWDCLAPERPDELDFPDAELQALAFTSKGELVCLAAESESILHRGLSRVTIQVWNPKTGQRRTIAEHLAATPGPPSCKGLPMALSPDGEQIATVGEEGKCKLWRLADGELLQEFPGRRGHALAFSHDGSQLAVGGLPLQSRWGPAFTLWDIESGQQITEAKALAQLKKAYDRGKIILNEHEDICFSADGQFVITAHASGALGFWTGETGTLQNVLYGKADNTGRGRALAFSPDNEFLAVGGNDRETDGGMITLWQTGSWIQHARLIGHTMPVTCVRFSPDGKTMASASIDGTVSLWDPVIGQRQLVLRPDQGVVRSLDFSPDGKILATSGEEGKVRLWYAGSP